MASSARRGKVSNCSRKTRTTWSGITRATSASCPFTRARTRASAPLTSALSLMLGSTGEGVTTPSGSASKACCSSATRRLAPRAAATPCGPISQASAGLGRWSSQRVTRSRGDWAERVSRLGDSLALLNECHLVDFPQRGQSGADFGDAAIAQEGHALVLGAALDFAGGPAVDNHLPNMIGEVEQLVDGGASAVAGARTFQA